MYTNIDTAHALATIPSFLRRYPHFGNPDETTALIEGLEIIMKNNIFQFGNTYWLQKNGTAMGVSPSCMYATLYYANHEESLNHQFPELHFYRRYIDDVLGIWVPKTTNDNERWLLFQQQMTFGKLQWTVSKRQTSVNFLDMTLTLQLDGKITTKIFEKTQNLYLYLPAQSAHPPSNLKGLIAGMIYRSLRLTSTREDQKLELQNLVKRLMVRGYSQQFLIKTINQTYQRMTKTQGNLTGNSVDTDDKKNVIFFHTTYHPFDPTSQQLQTAFDKEMNHPKRMYKSLENLLNMRKAKLGVNRMIIAYHRAPNLGNLLSSRIITNKDGPPVSSYI
jgi:hypothetical protein